MKLLQFDGAGIFVQTAFIAADIGAKFLAEREIFRIVTSEIVLGDFITGDVRIAADGPVEGYAENLVVLSVEIARNGTERSA